jgi:hypothetical protein
MVNIPRLNVDLVLLARFYPETGLKNSVRKYGIVRYRNKEKTVRTINSKSDTKVRLEK